MPVPIAWAPATQPTPGEAIDRLHSWGGVWHKDGVVMRGNRPGPGLGKDRKPRAAPRPLNAASLDDMAIRYVSRFATTRAKLRDYLRRKLRERGWTGDGEPAIDPLIEKVARLGYVDDAAFASAKGKALTARGLGRGRVTMALRVAGVSEDDGAEARNTADEGAVEALLHFARRKRIGPWAAERPDRQGREKWIGAMLRAGHPLPLARVVATAEPGDEISAEQLGEFRA